MVATVQVIFKSAGRRSTKNANRIFGHFGDVFVVCARSARQISISARPPHERDVFVVLVGPGCPGKSFSYEILPRQGLMRIPKFRYFHEIFAVVACHVGENYQIHSLTRISMLCGGVVFISNHT